MTGPSSPLEPPSSPAVPSMSVKPLLLDELPQPDAVDESAATATLAAPTTAMKRYAFMAPPTCSADRITPQGVRAPQEPQNFASGAFSAPHDAQRRAARAPGCATGAPQLTQKRDPGRTSVPQAPHCDGASSVASSGGGVGGAGAAPGDERRERSQLTVLGSMVRLSHSRRA